MAQNKAAAKEVKFLEVTVADPKLTFALGDGQTLVVDVRELSPEVVRQAMLHGINQKVRDSAAGFSKEKDYDGAFEAMDAVVSGLQAGEWNRRASGVGVNINDLATAIAEIKKAPFEKALAAVKSWDDAKKKEVSKNAKVAAIIAKLRSDRATAAAKSAEDLDVEL